MNVVGPEGIPKIIHRYWIGPVPYPARGASYDADWRDLHPEWIVAHWTPEQLPTATALAERTWWGHGFAGDRARHYANCARYWLLWAHGGVWADIDLRPLRPISSLLDIAGRPAIAGMHGAGEGCFMVGPPGDDFFADLLTTLDRPIGDECLTERSGASLLRRVASRNKVDILATSYIFTHDVQGRPIDGPHYTRHGWDSSALPDDHHRDKAPA